MNGAEALVATAIAKGIKVCFANAGTTEMPILRAFDSTPGVRGVLGLFEGVCTGAADGYGRLLDRPAMVLLHLGPGFANGIANLHNARRAGSPLFVVIGEHATWHQAADAPLAMNIEGLADTVSRWRRTNGGTESLSRDTAEAIVAARSGCIATLVTPCDYLWTSCSTGIDSAPAISCESVDSLEIENAVSFLRSAAKPCLILGGRALRKRGLVAAARIKAAAGCELFTGSFPGYVDRGSGITNVTRIPYFPEPAIDLLAPFDAALICGAKEPVCFFGYEGVPSYILCKGQKKLQFGREEQDHVQALEALADSLGAPPASRIPPGIFAESSRPAIPEGELSAERACAVIAAMMPENAILVDEGITSTMSFYPSTAGLPPHSYLTIAGGSIGYGIPCAVGASLACPERPVINVQADGSAMYTLQALWTAAREELHVITLICANRSYNIIRAELARAGVTAPGNNSLNLIDLDRPVIEWALLAKGMGVRGTRVTACGDLVRALTAALSEKGPSLIELALP
jgi:acetolactate synthase I/II/III large subunit